MQDNITKVIETINSTQNITQAPTLFFVDAEKVFEWTFLKQVVKSMHLGSFFENWIEMLNHGQKVFIFKMVLLHQCLT